MCLTTSVLLLALGLRGGPRSAGADCVSAYSPLPLARLLCGLRKVVSCALPSLTMDAVDIPPPEVAGIYCGSMVVFLALLSSFRQRALFSYVYILAPSIRLVILCGIAGWAAVVWAMASGRASTAAEQVLVLTAFTLGAVTDVSKELQLCNLEWNYDLFAAVAWANLIATHRAARAEEVRLAAASSADLNAEVRTLYVRLVASPTIALPPSWLRVLYYFLQLQKRIVAERELAAGTARSGSGREPRRTAGPARAAAAHDAHGRGGRFFARVASAVRIVRSMLGSWNPRSVFFGVTRGSLLVPALPIFLVFAMCLALQYLRAYCTLAYKVEGRLARYMARSWLWNAFLGPPTLLPVSGAWSLWMLAAAINEKRANDLICAMTRPQETPVASWGQKRARKALGNTCGAARYHSSRPPRSRAWRAVSWVLFLPVNRWRQGFPTSRELYFKFALSALNIHATRSGDETVPKVQCTLDDVINGNVVALKELYEGLGEVVHQRWVEVEEHLITTGTIDRTVGNGAPPFSPDGLNLEEGGRASTAGSSHAEHTPLSDPSALFNGASPLDGWASVPAVASSGGAPTDWTQRPPDG